MRKTAGICTDGATYGDSVERALRVDEYGMGTLSIWAAQLVEVKRYQVFPEKGVQGVLW
jgi:hypothetical protein